MWHEIILMFAELPGEHVKQEAQYKEQMQCLREKRCYSFLDTRDNTWVIRKKENDSVPTSSTIDSIPKNQKNDDFENDENTIIENK